MKIEYLLFDLDNTLYPENSGMSIEIGHRMTAFVSKHLGIPPESAKKLRRQYRDSFGTTLQGLVSRAGFKNPERFFTEVHPENVENYIKRDPELKRMLSGIKIPKSILTNSPSEHAERVLNYLDIKDSFEHIFDIRFNNLNGKPAFELYEKVLSAIGKKPENVLFIDDLEMYLRPFKEIGGSILLVNNRTEKPETADIPVINSIKELPLYLASI